MAATRWLDARPRHSAGAGACCPKPGGQVVDACEVEERFAFYLTHLIECAGCELRVEPQHMIHKMKKDASILRRIPLPHKRTIASHLALESFCRLPTGLLGIPVHQRQDRKRMGCRLQCQRVKVKELHGRKAQAQLASPKVDPMSSTRFGPVFRADAFLHLLKALTPESRQRARANGWGLVGARSPWPGRPGPDQPPAEKIADHTLGGLILPDTLQQDDDSPAIDAGVRDNKRACIVRSSYVPHVDFHPRGDTPPHISPIARVVR